MIAKMPVAGLFIYPLYGWQRHSSSTCLNELHLHGKTAFVFILFGLRRQSTANKTPGLPNTYLQSQPHSQSKVFIISDNSNTRTLSVIDGLKPKQSKNTILLESAHCTVCVFMALHVRKAVVQRWSLYLVHLRWLGTAMLLTAFPHHTKRWLKASYS